MQLLDDIGWFFGDVENACLEAVILVNKSKVTGEALSPFFTAAAGTFHDLKQDFFDFSDWWDVVYEAAQGILSWSTISSYISQTWTWIDDIAGTITDGVEDFITSQYSEITDFWGNVAAGVVDTITDQYSEITDFWGNVAVGVGDWFTSDFEDWIEDRAESIVNLAGRILDKLW